VRLAPKSHSYQQWSQALHEYASSERLLHEREYWLSQLSVPALTAAPAVTVEPVSPGQQSARSRVALNEEETQALLGECNAAYRTQVNELLLSALLVAYRSWRGESCVRVEMEGHGREELFDAVDTSETVGWFTTHYPLVLRAPPKADLSELIKAVKEQHRGVPNRGIGYGILRELCREESLLQADTGSAIVFNYLGQFDASVDEKDGFAAAQESSGPAVSERNVAHSPLTLNALVHERRLRFELTSASGALGESALQAFAIHFERALRNCIEHCLYVSALQLTANFDNRTSQDDAHAEEIYL
jgi:non-ribosomal peptide synthase protein (TIGR01720 family)